MSYHRPLGQFDFMMTPTISVSSATVPGLTPGMTVTPPASLVAQRVRAFADIGGAVGRASTLLASMRVERVDPATGKAVLVAAAPAAVRILIATKLLEIDVAARAANTADRASVDAALARIAAARDAAWSKVADVLGQENRRTLSGELLKIQDSVTGLRQAESDALRIEQERIAAEQRAAAEAAAAAEAKAEAARVAAAEAAARAAAEAAAAAAREAEVKAAAEAKAARVAAAEVAARAAAETMPITAELSPPVTMAPLPTLPPPTSAPAEMVPTVRGGFYGIPWIYIGLGAAGLTAWWLFTRPTVIVRNRRRPRRRRRR